MRGRFRRRLPSGPASAPDGPQSVHDLVLFEPKRWSLTAVDGPGATALTIDEVAAWALPTAPWSVPTETATIDPMLDLVSTVPAALLAKGDDGLWMQIRNSARWAALGPEDVRLLHGCPDSPHHLAAELGLSLDEVQVRLARLIEIGLCRPGPPRSTFIVSDQLSVEGVDPIYFDGHEPPSLRGDGVPVVGVYHPSFGIPLALGMVIANVRAWEGGRLAGALDVRPLATPAQTRHLLADHSGRAVLLLSNYVWSFRENEVLAEELVTANPDLIVVHGGPHTPKYEAEQEVFLDRPGIHVLVVGEGEQTAVELLDVIAGWDGEPDFGQLEKVAGVVFRHPDDGEIRRGPTRERIADLDDLPSPYLTGEFDDLAAATFDASIGATMVIETNRGCPFGCTFCDWGAATNTRVRTFAIDRVTAEFDWLAEHGSVVWMVSDANFGMLPRDLEITNALVSVHQRTGIPHVFGLNTAKNATARVTSIIDGLSREGIGSVSSLAMQTRDPRTLEAINRSNIKPERYDALTVSFREQRLPILCDLILGLPGSTVTSFVEDLQWSFDREITPRAWVCQVLPNAPMNAPEYRLEHQLELDEDNVVIASATFTRADRAHMMQMRQAQRVFEHFGLLRHVLRYVQWDHEIAAMEVVRRIVTSDAQTYPLLGWTQQHFDQFPIPPLGWRAFYDEVERFLTTELGVASSPALTSVIDVQRLLMPDHQRTFPATVDLAHDYVTYYLDATERLRAEGVPTGPLRALADYGPGTFEVTGDSGDVEGTLCRHYDDRPPDLMPGRFWQIGHFELDSCLARSVPGYVPETPPEDRSEEENGATPLTLVPVTVGRTPSRA